MYDVCMYVCMYVQTRVYRVYRSVRVYVCVYIYMYICIHAPMDYGSLNPCVYLLTKLERTTLNTRGLRGPVPQLCKRQHRRARNEPSSCRRHLLPVRLEGAVPITDGRRASGLGLAVSVYRLTGDRDIMRVTSALDVPFFISYRLTSHAFLSEVVRLLSPSWSSKQWQPKRKPYSVQLGYCPRLIRGGA